jgi:hypothetical protein
MIPVNRQLRRLTHSTGQAVMAKEPRRASPDSTPLLKQMDANFNAVMRAMDESFKESTEHSRRAARRLDLQFEAISARARTVFLHRHSR